MSVRRVVVHDSTRTVDVVGDLVRLDEVRAVIDGRDGLVDVELGAVTHARLVGASVADELALDAVAARGLRAETTQLLDGWLLRADHGFTSRANSVLPTGRLVRPLDDALAAAHDWYAARGLPVRIQVARRARAQLDAELAQRGWTSDSATRVYMRRLEARPARADVELAAVPTDDWLSLYRGGQGTTATGRALLARHDGVTFATVRHDDRTVAVGRGAVDDGWLGIMAVEVAPAHRRSGLARLVMDALSSWGPSLGATRATLQVGASNVSAIALYESLGYWHHHDYHYRVEPRP